MFYIIFILTIGLANPFYTIAGDNAIEQKGSNYLADEILVKFKDDVKVDTIDQINAEMGVKVIEQGPLLKFYRLQIPSGTSIEEVIKKYQKYPEVKYAEPNYIMRVQ